jgi:hypothetical protein
MQQVLDSRRGASKGFPRTLDKMKNKAVIGKGLEQIRKSREYARNARQLALTSLGIVVRHIFSKPDKEYDSMHIIKY